MLGCEKQAETNIHLTRARSLSLSILHISKVKMTSIPPPPQFPFVDPLKPRLTVVARKNVFCTVNSNLLVS